jgi:hypothetical protein
MTTTLWFFRCSPKMSLALPQFIRLIPSHPFPNLLHRIRRARIRQAGRTARPSTRRRQRVEIRPNDEREQLARGIIGEMASRVNRPPRPAARAELFS